MINSPQEARNKLAKGCFLIAFILKRIIFYCDYITKNIFTNKKIRGVTNMQYTKFGEFMRILRIKHHEVMSDTAKLFNCKVPFVSSVENGKKNIPDGWEQLLIEHYHLTPNEQLELHQAIESSKTQIKIDLINTSTSQRTLAVLFQRSFEKMDESTVNAIMELLSKKENH